MNDIKIKYTAFIDVLGFSEFIKTKITNDKEAESFYSNLKKIIEYLKYQQKDTFTLEEADYIKDFHLEYTWISDTFVITLEYNKEKVSFDKNQVSSMLIFILSLIVSSIHHFFIKEYNLIVRGGISDKYTYINEHLLLGSGISEAHYLESVEATNPRVIFAKEIITDKIIENLSLHFNDNILNIISKDNDEYYFVNYLSAIQIIPPMIGLSKYVPQEQLEAKAKEDKQLILDKYLEVIKDGEQSSSDKVKKKYAWLKQYYKEVTKHVKFSL